MLIITSFVVDDHVIFQTTPEYTLSREGAPPSIFIILGVNKNV